jgi:hypothetical protein
MLFRRDRGIDGVIRRMEIPAEKSDSHQIWEEWACNLRQVAEIT